MNERKRAVLGVVAATLAVAACDTHSRPSIQMLAEVNSLSLSTAETLVVTRALINNGANDVWVNVSAASFEMKDASGQPACHTLSALALVALELVRLQPDSTLLDERKYALEDKENCGPGSYSLAVVASVQTQPEGGESITLRTPPSAFTITAPPVALRR
jgi:hypothetical protein